MTTTPAGYLTINQSQVNYYNFYYHLMNFAGKEKKLHLIIDVFFREVKFPYIAITSIQEYVFEFINDNSLSFFNRLFQVIHPQPMINPIFIELHQKLSRDILDEELKGRTSFSYKSLMECQKSYRVFGGKEVTTNELITRTTRGRKGIYPQEISMIEYFANPQLAYRQIELRKNQATSVNTAGVRRQDLIFDSIEMRNEITLFALAYFPTQNCRVAFGYQIGAQTTKREIQSTFKTHLQKEAKLLYYLIGGDESSTKAGGLLDTIYAAMDFFVMKPSQVMCLVNIKTEDYIGAKYYVNRVGQIVGLYFCDLSDSGNEMSV